MPPGASWRAFVQTIGRVCRAASGPSLETNFEIGRHIVEHERRGQRRAAYGAELLQELSARLTKEFGRGFSVVNLSSMRRFFLLWQERVQIIQSPTEKLSLSLSKGQSATAPSAIIQAVTEQSGSPPFRLSWTHYVELLGIKYPDVRSFYEIESASSGWNVRELKRQKASALYHRLALSRDKAGIKLTDQDLGQMQMYVNYFDRHVKLPEENPTIGLLLCREKNDAVVRLILPKDANIHAKEYQLYLPSKELLQAKLLEWTRAAENRP